MAGQTTNYLFDYPTSTDYVKDGATAIQTLATDVDTTLFTALGGAYPGLRLVKKQTIGSNVASVSVTGAFSATYENYIIKVTNVDFVSPNQDFVFKLNGSTNTHKYYIYYANMDNGSTGAFRSAGTTSWFMGFNDVSNDSNFTLNLNSPFLTVPTSGQWTSSNNAYYVNGGGWDTNAVSQTGFTISGTTNMTGGTIYVYGYGAS